MKKWWLADGEKNWRYVYSFRQNTRTWQTDGQTDRQADTARRHRPRLCIASRGNNAVCRQWHQHSLPLKQTRQNACELGRRRFLITRRLTSDVRAGVTEAARTCCVVVIMSEVSCVCTLRWQESRGTSRRAAVDTVQTVSTLEQCQRRSVVVRHSSQPGV